ncbi:sugar phosphate isomerase/epimerase family protein [Aquabacterium humicola]|uniref:sugar phosphate isomerase/epimerase family protein n=1 Tax=Aquabacterium humicola TaxID=3237377 RepID=UPI002543F741|nr:sugar phosphate isomerase/epimerase family protein [Rubrivivax pictus]
MKLALCNEVLRHLAFEQQCARAAALGCDGLEIAPFTLADDPRTLNREAARRVRDTAAAHGLAIASLHWLLVKPAGLSLSTPDTALQSRTVDFLRRLIDFAAACGAQVLVHGSPLQRSPVAGQSVADALSRCEAGWAALAPHAEGAGITYCIEALSPAETPVLNTIGEVLRLLGRIGSPALKTMLDLSAAAQSEPDDAVTLLERHLGAGDIAHVQLNDRNRRGPGQGDTPVAPVIAALRRLGYAGWLAIEPFDYQPDAESCAAYSCGYVRALLDAGEQPA